MKFSYKIVYVLLFLVIGLSFLSYSYFMDSFKEKLIKEQKELASISVQEFDRSLKMYLTLFQNNLISISKNRYFMEYLESKHKRHYLIDDFENIINSKVYSEELFLSIVTNSNDIFQLRYLDPFGKEIIRVDKNRDAEVYLADDLQDKSKRYYFTETKKIKENSFWFSQLDLNIEYGQIEMPIRPTLRVSTPVYTNGVFDGILIANIDMTHTLNLLFKNTKFKKALVDKDGHILFSNDDKLKNWSRYLNTDKFDKTNYSILTKEKIDLKSNEELSLKVYHEKGYLSQLLMEDKVLLLFYIFIFDIFVFLIFFMVFKNSFLKEAIEKALINEKDLQDKINSFMIMSKTDANGNITYVTDEFCRLSGYSKEELIGKKHNIIKDSEADSKVYKELWSTITKGEVFHTKLPIITKDKKRKYWGINIFPKKDDNGKIIEYIAYRRDETAQTLLKEHNEILEKEIKIRTHELEQTIERLNVSNEKLTNLNEELACSDEELRAQQEELLERQERIIELSEAKEQFLSNMSHEIRTPLNGIVGITDILLNDSSISKNVADKLNIIKSSSRILNTVVNDILDYTALKSGKIKIYENEFSLKEMINNIEHLMRLEIMAKGLDFQVKMDENISEILIGDEFRINQVIMNLLSNAKKFTNKGFIKLNINTVKKDEKNIRLRFSVIDSGVGMNEELKKNIFTAFTQSDKSNTSKHRGTGLGLSICKYLIDIMGGKIWFESEPNKGTMMFFSLNLKYSNQTDVSKKSRADKFVTLKEKKIALLVEDDLVNQIVAKTFLEKIGFSVDIANNGLEAVELCKTNNYDIIFMDIQMPVMDGYNATIKIKEFDEKTPIIALSAGALAEDIHRSYEVGMNMHISKPIVAKDINNIVEKFFEIKQSSLEENATLSLENKKTEHIINFLELMQTFNDKQTVDELLDIYKNDYENFEFDIKTLDESDIKKYIHKLRGASGNLKFKVIEELCRNYEENPQNRDVILEEISDKIKSLMIEIDNF